MRHEVAVRATVTDAGIKIKSQTRGFAVLKWFINHRGYPPFSVGVSYLAVHRWESMTQNSL